MIQKFKYVFTTSFIFFILAINPALSQQSEYIALITDIQGDVNYKKASRAEFEKALWGIQLFQNDQIKTLKDSEVSLLFSNNNLVTLGANSSITISTGSQSKPKKSRSIKSMDSELVANLSILALRTTNDGEIGALAGLRAGNSDELIVLLTPRNTKIKNRRPSLKWNKSQTFDEYKVTVFNSDGPVWTKKIKKFEMKYPEDEEPLDYGSSYFWQVEGIGLFDSFKTRSVGFTVLSQKEVEQVELQEEKVNKLFNEDSNSSNSNFVLGSYYTKKGLVQNAIDHFEIIANMNPNAPLPHQILGKLYKTIGLKDKAISELQKAVELSQERN